MVDQELPGRYASRYSRRVSATSLEIGALLDGRYRLLGFLGRGGTGCVYEAMDLRLSRTVALKALYADTDGSAQAGERLFREARAAASSDHPAIATTYGFGVDHELGVSFVVMERLKGETLAQRIERTGPLPVELVIEVASELLDALAVVHEAEIVHRDIKPSNVFLATRGRRVDEVKLLDFGAARLLDLHTLTATGDLYGTPMYMAPEQLRDASSVDARSDLYSLGLVLEECLTGEPPFKARNLVVLTTEILLGRSVDVRKRRPDCPDVLAALIARCTRAAREERFVDARSAAQALSQSKR
ncbi:MAG: Protein kinase [Myxococcaceae bacterium]|nr:Protein kinase [Myxococcaceae bacterium]